MFSSHSHLSLSGLLYICILNVLSVPTLYSFSFVLLLLFSLQFMPSSLWHHGLQHPRRPCPLLSPIICSNSYPLSQWCYLTVSSSSMSFSFWLQSFPASGCFWMSQCSSSGGQSIGASASTSVLPMNIQGWFLLELTGLISLMSMGFSWVFCSTTIQKH